MISRPWLKFYPQDWLGDPKLRACSIAARGLWIDLISLAHEAAPYGHVLVNGNTPDTRMLARLTGLSDAECEALVAELELNGVFSRTRQGVIYSRRMVQDAKRAKKSQQNGKMGGNPTLSKQKRNKARDNPPHNRQHKPQIPDTRNQSYSVTNVTGGQPPSIPDFLKRNKAVDPAKVTYDRGREILASYEVPQSNQGGLITKWRKELGNDDITLQAIFTEAGSKLRHDIVAFISGCVRERGKDGNGSRSAQSARYAGFAKAAAKSG